MVYIPLFYLDVHIKIYVFLLLIEYIEKWWLVLNLLKSKLRMT